MRLLIILRGGQGRIHRGYMRTARVDDVQKQPARKACGRPMRSRPNVAGVVSLIFLDGLLLTLLPVGHAPPLLT